MEDETKKETPKEEEKPISLVDEARGVRDEIRKEREEIKQEREALEKAQAEALLSGTAGGKVETEPAKVETAKEYSERVMKNEVKE